MKSLLKKIKDVIHILNRWGELIARPLLIFNTALFYFFVFGFYALLLRITGNQKVTSGWLKASQKTTGENAQFQS